MKRSQINEAIIAASKCFRSNGWHLPPHPRWDITDFGLGSFINCGLVLVNLAEEPEYCEKIMYAVKNQITPAHRHHKKKEDIICRCGILVVQLWTADPLKAQTEHHLVVRINGQAKTISSGEKISLRSGERITINPGVWHEFYPASEECMIGEVSTANDDLNDNFFSNQKIGRFSQIDEDEALIVKLVSEQ